MKINENKPIIKPEVYIENINNTTLNTNETIALTLADFALFLIIRYIESLNILPPSNGKIGNMLKTSNNKLTIIIS